MLVERRALELLENYDALVRNLQRDTLVLRAERDVLLRLLEGFRSPRHRAVPKRCKRCGAEFPGDGRSSYCAACPKNVRRRHPKGTE
jgi:hypothetical protein